MEKEFDRIYNQLQKVDEDIKEKISFRDGRIKIDEDVVEDDRLDEIFAIFSAVPSEIITNVRLPDKLVETSKRIAPLSWGKMYSTKKDYWDVRYEDVIWATHDGEVELIKVGEDYVH